MKNKYYFITLFFLGSLLFSCKTQAPKSVETTSQSENVENQSKNNTTSQPKPPKPLPENIAYPNEFVKSQQAWLAFKSSTENSYKYVITDASWSGLRWETTITVEKGAITKRSFQYTSTKGLPENISAEEREWTEEENEIGAHENGAEPLTLDEVYAKARAEWLLKRENTEFFFETKNNGLISTCGYVLKNCADDCFRGINIKKIERL